MFDIQKNPHLVVKQKVHKLKPPELREMIHFFGITEIRAQNTQILTEFYFELIQTKRSLIISCKSFPISRFITFLEQENRNDSEKNKKILRNLAYFTFQESSEFKRYLDEELEFVVRKLDIELIILHEIDFIFYEKPGISSRTLQNILFRFKKMNTEIDFLVKFIKKRASLLLSLQMEYFIDHRYFISKNENKILVKDLTQ